MVGDVELHHALAQLLQLRASACAPSCRPRPAWCTTPGSPCGRRSRPGTAGTSRRAPGCRWRTAWAPGCRRRPRRASARCPAGTVTSLPSISSVTSRVGLARGRAVVGFLEMVEHRSGSCISGSQPACGRARQAEVLRVVIQRRQHRERASCRPSRTGCRGPSCRTGRAAAHLLRAVRETGAATSRSITSTPRVEPMRQGVHLPQDSMRAELHRVARQLRQVGRVVVHDDAAVADRGADRRVGLVVERHVPLRLGHVGAQRAAHLHRLDRPARARAAAEVEQQFAQRDAERPSRPGRRA